MRAMNIPWSMKSLITNAWMMPSMLMISMWPTMGNKDRGEQQNVGGSALRWKDTTTSWISIKDLKECNPVDVADYVVANKLVLEPAF
jgi:hypothetical protein